MVLVCYHVGMQHRLHTSYGCATDRLQIVLFLLLL